MGTADHDSVLRPEWKVLIAAEWGLYCCGRAQIEQTPGTELGMAHQSPIPTSTSTLRSVIPDKLYFRIGEVARLCEVPTYVLRFWESEFPQLKPNKGGTGQRLFRRRDVEMALRIKGLLYDEGYTIPGARQLLKGEQKLREPELPLAPEIPHAVLTEQLHQVRMELKELLAMVSGMETAKRPALARQASARTPLEPQTETLFEFEKTQDQTGKGRETDEQHG